MSDPMTIASTPDAPWLPPGSTAEVCVGTDLEPPEPSIIVRILLTHTSREPRFFCVASDKGLDLPTLFLGHGPNRMSAAEGLQELVQRTVRFPDRRATCIGWVRNIVPLPNGDYRHPTPDAYVPVFHLPDTQPAVPGEWVTIDRARASLTARHWWPIVHHHLIPSPSARTTF